jgi:hypothetical protein
MREIGGRGYEASILAAQKSNELVTWSSGRALIVKGEGRRGNNNADVELG